MKKNAWIPSIKVSEEEKAKIHQRFESSGLGSFSEWARRKLLGMDDFLDPEAVEIWKRFFRKHGLMK